MSLSALVKFATPVRARMAAELPRPRLPLKAQLLVPARARNRPLIGTAFDYLFRFNLARRFPFAVSRQWVAESALRLVSRLADQDLIMLGHDYPGDYRPAVRIKRRMAAIVEEAKGRVASFVAGARLSDALIVSAINLAHCDIYYRAGRLDERFGRPMRAQVSELRSLIQNVDWKQISASRVCLLNPHFGDGSRFVGGADADALLDDLLLDVKTTGSLKIRTEDWRQLLAYAALNLHFPIGGGKRRRRIRRIGFYFSRHGYLVSWPLAEVVDSVRFAKFAEWLREFAEGLHVQRLARRARANKRPVP
jgi:hypothetical protein